MKEQIKAIIEENLLNKLDKEMLGNIDAVSEIIAQKIMELIGDK